MTEKFRLMAVHAHPDDESSKGAATMARYVAEGHEVMVVTCTGGEAGSILNPAMQREGVAENMAAIRKTEMAQAAEILGIKHKWLGFIDSGLPEGDPLPALPEGCFALTPLEESVPPLVQAIREFRPHVLITYDENGGYPHPDHIRCHEISIAAFAAAADPQRYSELGSAWQVPKLYYSHGFSLAQLVAVNDAMIKAGLGAPYQKWIDGWHEVTGVENTDVINRVTTQVECADYFPVRDAALRAHQTQIDPNSGWFTIPLEIEREVWPTEEYELVQTYVDTTLPENDLFSGLAGYEGRIVKDAEAVTS